MALSIILFVIALWLGWKLAAERRRVAGLKTYASMLAGYADLGRAPFEVLQQITFDWVQIAQGGDNSPGTFANMNACPCRHTYTCATIQFPLNAWPNPNPDPTKGFPQNAPPRAREPWPCPGNCLIVPTKIWRGWDVQQNTKTGAIVLNINTFCQYHCKEPTDPDINKAPEGAMLPPKPEPKPEPEPKPKPGEVTN